MTLLWLCIGWVFASALVAMLPMRLQYIPGVTLLICAPILLIFMWIEVGPWLTLLGLFAFVSMFRNPLRYFWARARGQSPELPK